MKTGLWAMALAVWLPALWPWSSDVPIPATVRLVLIGDTQGYLSPCGCVKPMAGGIRRRLAALRLMKGVGPTVVVDSGGLVSGRDRQDEIKAETLAESARAGGVAALGLRTSDARLGPGLVQAIDRLSGGVVTTLGLKEDNALGIRPWIVAEPFMIVSVPSEPDAIAESLLEQPASVSAALRLALKSAEAEGLVPVALLDQPLAESRDFAERWPEFKLVVARGQSSAMLAPETVGQTLVVTGVEKANVLLSLEWSGSAFVGYRALSLGPEIPDDAEGSHIFRTYTRRVDEERLIDRLPRVETPSFAGSASCAPCHSSEYIVWKESAHGSALKTLEDEGQDRDPECTGCHVVGLDSTVGFRDRKTTPNLANVGCESCHGPSRAHVMDPAVRTPKKAADSCLSCHNPAHSPGFDFDTYWPKIRH